jgi:hypothetical protein
MRSRFWPVFIGVIGLTVACSKAGKTEDVDVTSDKLTVPQAPKTTVVGPAGTVQAAGNAQNAQLQLTNDAGSGSINVAGGQTHITGTNGKTLNLPGLP